MITIQKAVNTMNMRDSRFFARLHALFHPLSVAVVGASDNPGKLGFHVMTSLTRGGFKGRIAPVNPGAEWIMGIRSFPSIQAFEEELDLVIVAIPAQRVHEVFEACIKKKVKGIVLITAGFKEIDDPRGEELQKDLAEMIERAGIPVIGPNTFGMVNLHEGLNASFTPQFSLVSPGKIALVSQSGGISHLLAFMAIGERAGMSKIVGLGNRLNVDFPEMVTYLMEDAETGVIALYLEGLDDPRRLMEAAGRHRARKPIIAYKTGSAGAGDRASFSHTGSLAGKGEIYGGALRQAGILCLQDAESLLDAARALASCPLPQGRRVAILSGQAGPGMAACDICEKEGLLVEPFGPKTQTAINRFLPPLALRTNPVDMGPAWYDAGAIGGILRAVMDDEEVAGILILMMFASANRDSVAGMAAPLLEWKQKKPVLACLSSPPGIWDDHVSSLEGAGALVNFSTPERAAKAMASLWHYRLVANGAENDRQGKACKRGPKKGEDLSYRT